jgi:hypothetical protein
MADKDTVFPYDDEVVDPYAADDTKNPHESSGEAPSEEETAEPAPRKATRATKTVKKA